MHWEVPPEQSMSTANPFEPKLPGAGKPTFYEFGPFLLDTILHVLPIEGRPVALTPKDLGHAVAAGSERWANAL